MKLIKRKKLMELVAALCALLSVPQNICADRIGSGAGPFQAPLDKGKGLIGNFAFVVLDLIKWGCIPITLLCIFWYMSTNMEQKRHAAMGWGITAVVFGVLAWSGAMAAMIDALFS